MATPLPIIAVMSAVNPILGSAAIVAEIIAKLRQNLNTEATIDFVDEIGSTSKQSGRLQFFYQGRVFSHELSRAIVSVAPLAWFNIPIQIEGESGSGKRTLAWSIHGSSGASGPFVSIDCSGCSAAELQSSYSEAANGTLYLENIDALDEKIQKVLVHLLDVNIYSSVDTKSRVRTITASEIDLASLVSTGKLSQDLHQRLRAGYVKLPPLRQQPEAVLPMFKWFYENVQGARRSDLFDKLFAMIFRKRAREPRYSEDLEQELVAHQWPGNYRELRGCAYGSFVDSRLRGLELSARVVKKYINSDRAELPTAVVSIKSTTSTEEMAIQARTLEVLTALRQGEKKYSESLGAYFRRTGLRGPIRISVGRRIVLAYAKFTSNELRLIRKLGYVEGKPTDRASLESSNVNMNNYTTFLNELDLKATTVRDPIKVDELSHNEQLWFKKLKRKQVL